ncbi:MAG: hypothetical protein ABFD82_03805 [Syntrophaceae bacterium]
MCKHPPDRLYSGFANNEKLEPIMWIGCCKCGEIIAEIPVKERPRKKK